jgi:hypothetical protein
MLQDPQTPIHAVMPSTTQTVLTIVIGLIVLIELIYAVTESRRRRDLVPLFAMVGAGLAVFWEPIGDMLIKAYYPKHGQDTWFTAFGRPIPVFVGLLFIVYMSAASLWLLRASKHGISAKQWWTYYLGLGVITSVFEMFVLSVGGKAWIYYGRQPLVLHAPVLTTLSNCGFIVALAAGTTALARFLPRKQLWLIVPAVPVLFAGSQAGTALPLAYSLYSTRVMSLLILGALGSVALSAIVSHTCSRAFRHRWPPDRAELTQLQDLATPTPRVERARQPVGS